MCTRLKYLGFLGRYLSCHQYTCEHIEQAYAIRNQLSSYAVGCTKVAKSRFLCVKLVTTHGIELKYGITPILNCQNILNYNYMSQQIIWKFWCSLRCVIYGPDYSKITIGPSGSTLKNCHSHAISQLNSENSLANPVSRQNIGKYRYTTIIMLPC